jgi:hypothetical protein
MRARLGAQPTGAARRPARTFLFEALGASDEAVNWRPMLAPLHTRNTQPLLHYEQWDGRWKMTNISTKLPNADVEHMYQKTNSSNRVITDGGTGGGK